MERVYPDSIPYNKDEPHPDKFMITQVDSCGHGIVTLDNIKKGELVFRFEGEILDHQTLFTLQLTATKYIEDPYIMGKVLHSCDPNMRVDMPEQRFYAAKNINDGELLTMDYESTEDYLFREFQCHCGSDNCRGLIRGAKYAD